MASDTNFFSREHRERDSHTWVIFCLISAVKPGANILWSQSLSLRSGNKVAIEDEPVLVSGGDTTGPSDSAVAAIKPRFRRSWLLIGIGFLVAAVITALVNAGRAADKDEPLATSEVSVKTIQDYIKDNGITAVQVRRGDPGAPVIGLGLPRGWSDLGEETPEWAYAGAVYDKAVDPNEPPTIDVLLSKLTGNVDPAKILEYAPGELKNLADYQTVAEEKSKLGQYDAVQIAGLYTRDGKKYSIAQKTVVINFGDDAVYVLQINADAPASDAPVLMQATDAIDKQAAIKRP